MRNYFYSIILLTFNACVACIYVAIYSNHACIWALISHHIGKVTFNSNITPYQDRTWHLGGHIGKFSFSGPQKLDIFMQKLLHYCSLFTHNTNTLYCMYKQHYH